MSHIEIFCSVYYYHVHADNRNKLAPSQEKGILVGYNDISKAYRVYIPVCRMIIVSKDVHFDDNRALRIPLYLPVEKQPTQESGVKLEEPDVQVNI